MPRNSIGQYSTTPGDNTDIGGINIAEGMLPSDVNNAMRELLSQLKEFQTGAGGDTISPPVLIATTATVGTLKATSTATFDSAVILSSDATLRGQSDLRFADSDSSNWVAFQAPATVSSNVTWTLPAADGTTGQVLSTDGSGTLSWASGGGGGSSISAGDSKVEVSDTGSDGTITFDTDGSERMRITNTGDVIIGGTTELDANGGLTIAKTNNYPDFNLFRDDGSIGSAQPLGRIKWWAKDTTSNIPLVHAYIEATGSGTHAAGDNPTDLVFATTPDGTETVEEAGRITQSGAYVLKGGTTAPGGVGITFPATQSASSNANTLDDYEEGTWTPVLTNLSNDATMSANNSGRYTKIGRMVHLSAYVETTALGSVTGNLYISGCPFTWASGAYDVSAGTTFGGGLNTTAGQSVIVSASSSGTTLQVFLNDLTTGASRMQATEWTDDGNIRLSIVHIV